MQAGAAKEDVAEGEDDDHEQRRPHGNLQHGHEHKHQSGHDEDQKRNLEHAGEGEEDGQPPVAVALANPLWDRQNGETVTDPTEPLAGDHKADEDPQRRRHAVADHTRPSIGVDQPGVDDEGGDRGHIGRQR